MNIYLFYILKMFWVDISQDLINNIKNMFCIAKYDVNIDFQYKEITSKHVYIKMKGYN